MDRTFGAKVDHGLFWSTSVLGQIGNFVLFAEPR